jgi:hypothetical protein
MSPQERYTEASKALNMSIFKISKKYKLSNVEIVGLVQSIIIALVQIYYTPKAKDTPHA